jgi:tetratricopeptide (TPR) repeat protein
MTKSVSKYLKRLVISGIMLITFQSNGMAQSSLNSLLSFANQLYDQGYYDEAITEFYRVIFWSENDSLRGKACLGLGLSYRRLNQWEKAIEAFNRAETLVDNDSLSQHIRLAQATTYIAIGDYNLAQLKLITLVHSSIYRSLKQEAIKLLLLSAILEHDWDKVDQFLEQFNSLLQDQQLYHDLRSDLMAAKEHPQKSTTKAKWLSTFLPGLGQCYAGDYRNAINAFLLNTINFSTTGWLAYCGEYSSAVVYFIFLTERYYSGNRFHAEQAVLETQNQEDERLEKTMLQLIQKLSDTN